MKLLLAFLLWCVLLVLCWPLAIFALIFFPLLWLLSIPFRILAFVVGGILRLLKAIILLPVRLLEPRKTLEARTA
jgi:hypothetical protein